MTQVTIVGVGQTGARIARHLCALDEVTTVCVVDPDRDRASEVIAGVGAKAVDGGSSYRPSGDDRVVVIAAPVGGHRLVAEMALGAGAEVVSTADSSADVDALLELDAMAADLERHVVVGAGFAPGLTDLLARHGAAMFDSVDEIHVAKVGTGGPACARQHHRALAGDSVDYRDGTRIPRRGRTGRELCWFPEPIGAVDCYRAALPDVSLLVPAFPGVSRVTARMSATRRDRLTALLPMFRAPHTDGGPGAVRVELRGRRGEARDVVLLGAMDHPTVAAAAVAGVATSALLAEELGPCGAHGLGQVDDAVPMLRALEHHGVVAAIFEG